MPTPRTKAMNATRIPAYRADPIEHLLALDG